ADAFAGVIVTQQAPATAVRIGAGPAHVAQTIVIPQSIAAMDGLRTRREELISQLDRATSRRNGVLEELGSNSRRDRAGLEERLTELDQRILQIEDDIAATERALTSTPPAVLGAAKEEEAARELQRLRDRGPMDTDVIAISMAFVGFFMLIPVATAYASRLWRRPAAPRALTVAAEGRLERIEHAIDAVAVEVDRVSEGQRFVTQLLSEAKSMPVRSHSDLATNS
ncbi:MAG: hypothetical protein M3403_01270, partial [Gemmatimonadota bacterium]|nr:hypothetical protein [Gemmatimonadota bacterium]